MWGAVAPSFCWNSEAQASAIVVVCVVATAWLHVRQSRRLSTIDRMLWKLKSDVASPSSDAMCFGSDPHDASHRDEDGHEDDLVVSLVERARTQGTATDGTTRAVVCDTRKRRCCAAVERSSSVYTSAGGSSSTGATPTTASVPLSATTSSK